jgi:hypothetical protein
MWLWEQSLELLSILTIFKEAGRKLLFFSRHKAAKKLQNNLCSACTESTFPFSPGDSVPLSIITREILLKWTRTLL